MIQVDTTKCSVRAPQLLVHLVGSEGACAAASPVGCENFKRRLF